MEEFFPWVASVFAVVGGIWTFFTKYSPLIITRRSTHKELLSLHESSHRNSNMADHLDHVVTSDGRKWVWRKKTNDLNIRKHHVSFTDIAESEVMSTYSEGFIQGELKRSYMTLRGEPFYSCVYYEGEGYNRVFESFPRRSDDQEKAAD